jgi:GNAT superfamily N-acetyltransferase
MQNLHPIVSPLGRFELVGSVLQRSASVDSLQREIVRMTTRLATAADVEPLADLINRAYLAAEGHFIDGARITPAEVDARMKTGVFLIACEAGDLPVASVYLQVDGPRAYLGLLAVDPQMQKRGHGRRLLDAAEAYCLAQGCRAIDILVVNLRTELLPLYEGRGFQRTGTLAFDDPRLRQPAHFVRMSKALRSGDTDILGG